MATTLNLLNNILVGLRKSKIPDTDTSITDTYHLLLLQQINSAKEEVESSWDWHALRTTVTVTTAAGRSEYSLLAAADSDIDVSGKSRLLYERTDVVGGVESSTRYAYSLPQAYDVTDSSEYRMVEAPWERLERMHFTDDDTQEQPAEFALLASDDDMKLRLWPTPNATRTLKLRFVIPQATLSDTDITTVVSVPSSHIWQRALFYANQERGEELGRPGSTLDRQANDALANAISNERTDHDNTSYPE